MPELPEILSRAKEMKEALVGKTIASVEVLQPKSLNVPLEEFSAGLTGAKIEDVIYRGKWIQVRTTQGWFLLNLGMGGEILLTDQENLPEKRRLIIDFSDSTCLSINFWWFGYAHYTPLDKLHTHEMTAKLGPNVIDLSSEDLARLFSGQRSRIKAFLLDQSKVAGIGNAYIHDILFLARLHPNRKIDTLSDVEIEALHRAIHAGLQPSIDKGGAFYESTLHGQKGGFQMEEIIIGYREGTPCPNCGTAIEKIKTGSTSSFICPSCQADA